VRAAITIQGGSTIRLLAALSAAAAVLAAGMLAGTASGSTNRAAGALQFDVKIGMRYEFLAACPTPQPEGVECIQFTGSRDISGLGRTTVTYMKTLGAPDCPVLTPVRQNASAAFEIAGKGTLQVTMAPPPCMATAPNSSESTGTIVAGSGVYAGATGTLRFTTFVDTPGVGSVARGPATDTWTGTLTVPGLEFDLVAPTITGATAKTVKIRRTAKSARVRYTVTAHDAVDGAVRVKCTPPSGSTFKLGRTKVTCIATDTSGNTAQASFVVRVRR
jgi:hypothetical protein